MLEKVVFFIEISVERFRFFISQEERIEFIIYYILYSYLSFDFFFCRDSLFAENVPISTSIYMRIDVKLLVGMKNGSE